MRAILPVFLLLAQESVCDEVPGADADRAALKVYARKYCKGGAKWSTTCQGVKQRMKNYRRPKNPAYPGAQPAQPKWMNDPTSRRYKRKMAKYGKPDKPYAAKPAPKACPYIILLADARIGERRLEVDGQCGLAVGDGIVINRGGANEEVARIDDFGSIITQNGVEFDHAAGEIVSLRTAADPPIPAPCDPSCPGAQRCGNGVCMLVPCPCADNFVCDAGACRVPNPCLICNDPRQFCDDGVCRWPCSVMKCAAPLVCDSDMDKCRTPKLCNTPCDLAQQCRDGVCQLIPCSWNQPCTAVASALAGGVGLGPLAVNPAAVPGAGGNLQFVCDLVQSAIPQEFGGGGGHFDPTGNGGVTNGAIRLNEGQGRKDALGDWQNRAPQCPNGDVDCEVSAGELCDCGPAVAGGIAGGAPCIALAPFGGLGPGPVAGRLVNQLIGIVGPQRLCRKVGTTFAGAALPLTAAGVAAGVTAAGVRRVVRPTPGVCRQVNPCPPIGGCDPAQVCVDGVCLWHDCLGPQPGGGAANSLHAANLCPGTVAAPGGVGGAVQATVCDAGWTFGAGKPVCRVLAAPVVVETSTQCDTSAAANLDAQCECGVRGAVLGQFPPICNYQGAACPVGPPVAGCIGNRAGSVAGRGQRCIIDDQGRGICRVPVCRPVCAIHGCGGGRCTAWTAKCQWPSLCGGCNQCLGGVKNTLR